MIFEVEGSKGDVYEVSVETSGGRFFMHCSCPAGQRGTMCKHRLAILAGEDDDIVSDNLADLDAVLDAFNKTKLPSLMQQIEVAALEKEKWSSREKVLKRQLGREVEQGSL